MESLPTALQSLKRIVFIAPPFAPKLQMARQLSQQLNLRLLPFSAVIAGEMADRQCSRGQKIKKLRLTGNYYLATQVAMTYLDEHTNELSQVANDGFVLEGLPQDVYQAQMMESMLPRGLKIDGVVECQISLSDELLRLRNEVCPELLKEHSADYEQNIVALREYYQKRGLYVGMLTDSQDETTKALPGIQSQASYAQSAGARMALM